MVELVLICVILAACINRKAVIILSCFLKIKPMVSLKFCHPRLSTYREERASSIGLPVLWSTI